MNEARPIPGKYKRLGKYIVVESGHSMQRNPKTGRLNKMKSYRIVGTMTGR